MDYSSVKMLGFARLISSEKSGLACCRRLCHSSRRFDLKSNCEKNLSETEYLMPPIILKSAASYFILVDSSYQKKIPHLNKK
ncbi:hypothetical protein CEXT_253611 [Caerostris extrusa]|uniref:Uncharacterized protein n=1 Tax=Caerostris extrusa TaxID=172846 RepID=A0AAV4RXU6_CAEEX|nr:hypothetical protein CEXT_253611 [Caerostris extrusa]